MTTKEYNHKHCVDLAREAFLYWFQGDTDRKSDNVWVDLHRTRVCRTKQQRDSLSYDVGVFLFDREFENRLSVFNQLVAFLKDREELELEKV